jgi:hypothetical protein
MNRIQSGLGHDNPWLRLGYAFLCYFAVLALAYVFGILVLPEGIMRELPIPAFTIFEEGESFFSLFGKTIGYNVLVLVMIIGTNHFRVQRLTFGYLPLYANTAMMGLFAGTNSFSGGVSAYTLEGWLLFLQVGMLEFSAYILACAATVPLAMFHADRWRGEQFRRIRGLREVRLSKQEFVFLLVALVLLVVAAVNEWKGVG